MASAYGNEYWEFAANGLMMKRFASINDVAIAQSDRKLRWERHSGKIDHQENNFTNLSRSRYDLC